MVISHLNIYDFGSSESDADKLKGIIPMYNSPRHNVTTDSLGSMVENTIDLIREQL
jgi:hypothetical protein